MVIENKEELSPFDGSEAYYLYQPKEKKCFLAWIIPETLEVALKFELKKVSENSYQEVYEYWWEDKKSLLALEKNGDRLEAYLTNVETKLPTIRSAEWEDWNEIDWGKMVWNEEYQDYLSEKGKPKSFFLLVDEYKDKEEILLSFIFENHLVLKDKDPQKNYIWYQFDYDYSLAHFIYDTLNYWIRLGSFAQKEVVAIPGEYGQVLEPWAEGGWEVNEKYHPTLWPERIISPLQDISHYDRDKWLEHNNPPALVISFLPTFSGNYKLEEKDKLTGTRWFRHLWEVFISWGVPVVLKCYPGFLRQMAMKQADWNRRLSNKVELPLQIGGKSLGTGNVIAFFNCEWIKDKKLSYSNWEQEWTKRKKEEYGLLMKD